MTIIFFGSSNYSRIVEEKLHKTFHLTAVVTTADKQIGREQIFTPTPVKQYAQENNIPCIATDNLTPNVIDQLKAYTPDFFVVADYRIIIPDEVLNIPKYAAMNIHHSLLPKYRNVSPAPSAILSGDNVTGVTVIAMSAKLDAGDILAQKEYTMKPNETTQSLLTTLNDLGADLAIQVMKNFDTTWKNRRAQEHEHSTWTKKMTKESGFIDVNNPPSYNMLDRMIRAYYPWPSVWTRYDLDGNGEKVIKFLPEQKVQVEGKKAVSYKDFINGYKNGDELLHKLTSTRS